MAERINYYLPYLRQGVTTLAAHDQVVGKRMIVPIKLTVTSTDIADGSGNSKEVEKEITLFGPGDVLGINERIISRLAPPPSISSFDSSLVPFIEFSEPDFLWRFSSLQTPDKKNWIPWVTLIVLKVKDAQEEGEFTEVQNTRKELPRQIQIKSNAVLPDLKEAWRWAHVHTLDIKMEKDTAAALVPDGIIKDPKKAVCRLLCPRKLKPQTKYRAFLIPTFKIGAEAAMGIDDGVEDRTQLIWDTPSQGAGNTIPYYHNWEFRTGTQGDFEFLVRKLKPRVLEQMGTRAIDCQNPGYGMQEIEGLELQMEAALKSLDTQYQQWGMDSTTDDDQLSKKKQEALASLLNKRQEKVADENGEIKTVLRVTPPVYGEWYARRAGEALKVNAASKNQWLEELNLDFRHRAAAGLGVQFVKENQEDLMKAAWEQFSKIKKVNRTLNLGRFGREVSTQMYKRLTNMKSTNLFKFALPVQNQIAIAPEKTLGAVLKNITVSNNMTQLKVRKYFSKGKISQSKIDFKPIDTTKIVKTKFKVLGLNATVKVAGGTVAGGTVARVAKVREPINTWPNGVVESARIALDPKMTIANKIKTRVSHFRNIEKTIIAPSTSDDELRPVKWHPEFHRPMYRFLRDLSQEYILPGLENVPQNTVGLLHTNRRFIEAFMMGLNHEMASELRWREFPTDMLGSYFRSFWDTSIYSVDPNEKEDFRSTAIGITLLEQTTKKYGANFNSFSKIEATYVLAVPSDIEKEVADAYEVAIEKWLLTRDEDKDIEKPSDWKKKSRLGDNPIENGLKDKEGNQNRLVLLIRGELLQKFSNTLIYLVNRKQDGEPNLDQNATRIFPVFEGALPPDMVFIGFPFKEEVDDAANYFIVFEERMTELRFGLDETQEGSTPGPTENDFSWEHFPALSQEGYLNGIQPTIFTEKWNNAAYISKVMTQKQVRAIIALKSLIPEQEKR